MAGLFYIGLLALLLVLVAHVGLKLFQQDQSENVEGLHPYGLIDNNDGNNNSNTVHNLSLGEAKDWQKLTQGHTSTKAYGPGPARTRHAHPGKRGPPLETIPNYPVPITANDLDNLKKDLQKDLDGYFPEKTLDDHMLKGYENNNSNTNNNMLYNSPYGGPVVGRPTKRPYKDQVMGVEERVGNGDFKSYENLMYNKDAQQFVKNEGINPHTQGGKYYSSYDVSPILGC